jgi:hypothetical protein
LVVLRVWAPFLTTPDYRARRIVYSAKDSRAERTWQITMPKLCLQCGRDEAPVARQFLRHVRNFETPGPILGAILALFLFFMLLSFWLFSSKLFLLAMLTLVGGAVLMYVKSWAEEVELSGWGCADHAETMACPDIVAHEDTLHVTVLTPRLAEAGRADVVALRKARQGYAGAGPATSSAPIPPARPTVRPGDIPPIAPPQPQSKQPYRRDELPPIKLDE